MKRDYQLLTFPGLLYYSPERRSNVYCEWCKRAVRASDNEEGKNMLQACPLTGRWHPAVLSRPWTEGCIAATANQLSTGAGSERAARLRSLAEHKCLSYRLHHQQQRHAHDREHVRGQAAAMRISPCRRAYHHDGDCDQPSGSGHSAARDTTMFAIGMDESCAKALFVDDGNF
jgi:hypothetical protein